MCNFSPSSLATPGVQSATPPGAAGVRSAASAPSPNTCGQDAAASSLVTPHVDSLSVTRPAVESPQVGSTADLPFSLEIDPCPATPADRATVHDLVAAFRTARQFGVRLLDVTQADVCLNPGDTSSVYLRWLAQPANFARVLAGEGCFDEPVGSAVGEVPR